MHVQEQPFVGRTAVVGRQVLIESRTVYLGLTLMSLEKR